MTVIEHILAVADLHGRLDLLKKLISEVLPCLPPATRLVFLGDYVDRGPDSAGVIEELLSLQSERPDTVFLMGNHEQMLANALGGREFNRYLINGGLETLRSYGAGPRRWRPDIFPAPHRAFVSGLRLHYRWRDFTFVHAGLRPGVALEAQNPNDLLWIRDEFFGANQDWPGTVVFGHTPFKKPVMKRRLMGIDTGAVFGGGLTCALLPERKLFKL